MNIHLDLPALFRAQARLTPEAPAILIDPVWSYGKLDQESDLLAAGLLAQGVRAGDRVGLYCPNGADFVRCYLAILKAEALVVPINLLLHPEEIAFILNDCGVKGLCVHPSLLETARKACAPVPSLSFQHIIGTADLPTGTGETHAPAAPPRTDESQIPADIPPRPDEIQTPGASPPDGDRDAVILYTSGTTGHPKGAVLTHANLAANAQAVAQALDLQPGQERVLVVLPMFHAFAATVGILAPLLSGNALIPVPRFDPALITAAVGDWRATLFLGVPSLYAALLRLEPAQVARWASVRLAISGGAALPLTVLEGFERRFGIPILEGDGPTECGPVTCVNPPAGPRKPGSVGPPLPGVEMAIANPDGTWCAEGEHGEVCVRGPSLMRGYWNLPEATAESFFGDWFRTGDLGWRDGDGWFYLVDRIKDLIIVNGMNVYPRIVEEVLHRHPAVAEAAVVGEPHPLHGEIPIAHVILKPDQTADPRALRDWCRDHLGRHEVPRRVEIRDALPRNAAGKILKRELRRAGEIERGVA